MYAEHPVALERHRFERQKLISGCFPAHMLCIIKITPLPLIRFLSGHNSRTFCVSCFIKDPLQYGRYPLHLAAEYSESVQMLQILQLDVSATKKTTFDGHTPLGILCGKQEFPSMLDMVQCVAEVDNSTAVIEGAIMNSLHNLVTYEASIEYSTVGEGDIEQFTFTLIDHSIQSQSSSGSM